MIAILLKHTHDHTEINQKINKQLLISVSSHIISRVPTLHLYRSPIAATTDSPLAVRFLFVSPIPLSSSHPLQIPLLSADSTAPDTQTVPRLHSGAALELPPQVEQQQVALQQVEVALVDSASDTEPDLPSFAEPVALVAVR